MTSQNPFISAIWKNGGNFLIMFFLWIGSEFTLKYQPNNLLAIFIQQNNWLGNLILYTFFVISEFINLSKIRK